MNKSELNGDNHNAARCHPSRPCNRWRTCARCARRRQAKIADAAERLFTHTGQLRWHILYPHAPGADALRAVRENWLRAAAPAGAIWTVEQSRKTGALHCNIITPADCTATPRAAEHWQQLIQGDPRAVGAYIAKRRQMPEPAAYGGRLYGTTGQLWQILAGQTQYPAVAAAAAQYAIDSEAMMQRAAFLRLPPGEQQRRLWLIKAYEDRQKAEPTRDEYRAIAAKWLPDLLEWKEKIRPKTDLELDREFCKRESSI